MILVYYDITYSCRFIN